MLICLIDYTIKLRPSVHPKTMRVKTTGLSAFLLPACIVAVGDL